MKSLSTTERASAQPRYANDRGSHGQEPGGIVVPLPMGHSLAAGVIYATLDEDGTLRGWRRLLVAVGLANTADLDLLPGLFVGDPNRFHRGASHSLITAAVVGLLVAAVAWRTHRWEWRLRGELLRGPYQTALVVGLLLGSHVLLDAFTADPSVLVGEQMLWPVSDAWIQIYPLFERADKMAGRATASEFFGSLISMHNARAMALEMVLVGPLLLWARWWRRQADD